LRINYKSTVMKTNFDEQIKSAYNQGEFEYKPSNWDQLRIRLEAESSIKKGGGFWLWMSLSGIKKMKVAAVVVTLLNLGIALYFFNKSHHADTLNSVSVISNAENKSSNTTSNPLSSKQNYKLSDSPQTNTSQTQQHVSSYNITTSASIKKQKGVANRFNHDVQNHQEFAAVNSSTDQTDTLATTSTHQNQLNIKEKINTHPLVEVQQNNVQQEIFFNQASKESTQHDHHFTVLGSVGKGSTALVYAAGINYQMQLTKRFFVDGDLAYYSSDIQNVVLYRNAKLSNSTSAGLFSSVSNTKTDAQLNHAVFSHIVFNPSLGFKVSKRVSLKAGLDIQKRVSGVNDIDYAASDDMYKRLPDIDCGFTPKIGFKVNRHWKTILMYRKGINNILSNTNYFNRDYVQCQLGYSF